VQAIHRVLSQLGRYGINTEAFGGDVQVVKVSALRREGLPELLDAIATQAAFIDLHVDVRRCWCNW